jgi:succinate dehydrogenase / fumarate reductase cytochrome b subunit
VKQTRPRPNYLGAGGWIWAGNYKVERYLYILHRITGLGLLLFGMLHLIETTFFRMPGQSMWEATMSLLENPWLEALLYLVPLAFVYHALNGLRLILQELGFLLGKPIRPVYPYKDSLRRKRPLALAMLVVIAVLAVIFLIDFIV